MTFNEALGILGIGMTATKAEARAAYRRLVMQCHPDVGGDAAMFQRLIDARRIVDASLIDAPCPMCGGTRRMRVGVGFNGVDVACSECG